MTQQKTDRGPLLLVGPKAPPLTGQSVAFEMLIDGLAGRREFEIVDLAERENRRDAQFSSKRAFSMLGILSDTLGKARRCNLVYLQIAQSRWGFLRDALIILAARLNGRRIVAHLHGGGYADFYKSLPPPFRWLIRLALRKIYLMIILSEGLRSNFAFLGTDYDNRLRVVANAGPVLLGTAKKAPEKKLRLLYLSNLLVEKGYLDCIDALIHIQRALPDVEVELILAGAFLLGVDDYSSVADLATETEKRIRYMETNGSVRLAGVVEGDAKLELLDSSHFLLLPTYYRNEGQPIAVIEGLARGTPCIVTAWRGTAEILGTEECGTVVTPGSSVEIAEAIVNLFNDPERYERLSENAVRRAEYFSIDRYISDLIDVFDEAQRK